jgi:hypothetical protein
MSYEDLQNTQAKRAEREKAIVDKLKVKRSRKRKSAAPEEPPASKVARTSEVLERAEGSWKALVAHMYRESVHSPLKTAATQLSQFVSGYLGISLYPGM